MKYKLSDISKAVGFYRRHQRIPTLTEIEMAWQDAQAGKIGGAVQILDWRRHCFLAKTEGERAALALVFDYARELFEE